MEIEVEGLRQRDREGIKSPKFSMGQYLDGWPQRKTAPPLIRPLKKTTYMERKQMSIYMAFFMDAPLADWS